MMWLPSAAASLPSERRVLSVRGALVINLKERLQTPVHANTFRGVNTVTRSNYLFALRARCGPCPDASANRAPQSLTELASGERIPPILKSALGEYGRPIHHNS